MPTPAGCRTTRDRPPGPPPAKSIARLQLRQRPYPTLAGTCLGLLYDSSNVVRTSVGVGLIWASPFGPLRFDYAIPMTKGQYDGCSSSGSAAEHRSKRRFRAKRDWVRVKKTRHKQEESSVLIDQNRSSCSITGRTATGGMAQPIFFEQPPSSTLADIAALTKAHLVDASRGGQQIRGLASLDEAGPMHLTFFDNPKYADQLASTKAGACLVSERFEATVPAHVAVLRARPAVSRVCEDRARTP